MGKRLSVILLWLMLFLSSVTVCHGEESQQMQTVQWQGHPLTVSWVQDCPAHIEISPETQELRLLLIRLACADSGIPLIDVANNVESVSIRDAEGMEYVASAYYPYAMVYNPQMRFFSSALTQPAFDLLFEVPLALSLEGCALVFSTSGNTDEISLDNVPLILPGE